MMLISGFLNDLSNNQATFYKCISEKNTDGYIKSISPSDFGHCVTLDFQIR